MILNYLNAMRETSNARLTRRLELAIRSLTPPAGKRRIIVAVSYGFICHFNIKKLSSSGYIEELRGFRYSVLPPDNIDNLDN